MKNALVVVFTLTHASYLLVCILPPQFRPSLPWKELTGAYATFTGSRQGWNMFESIPVLHDFNCDIVVNRQDGKLEKIGPILPGFLDYKSNEGPRTFCLLERITGYDYFAAYRQAYLTRVDEHLRSAAVAETLVDWSLQVEWSYTRSLFHIRRDNKLSIEKLKEYRVAPASVPPQ